MDTSTRDETLFSVDPYPFRVKVKLGKSVHFVIFKINITAISIERSLESSTFIWLLIKDLKKSPNHALTLYFYTEMK